MKTNQITSFHVYIKRNLKDFVSNETVKIYFNKKNYVNANITKINLDNQSYLNQLYDNNTRFFNILPISENNPRSNKKVTMQGLLNQFSETTAAVREILLSQ